MIWVPGVQIAHLRYPDHENTAVPGDIPGVRGAPDGLRRASLVTRVTARTQSDGLFRCEPYARVWVRDHETPAARGRRRSLLADVRNSLLADIKPVLTVSDAGQRSQAVSPALASARYLSPSLEKRR